VGEGVADEVRAAEEMLRDPQRHRPSLSGRLAPQERRPRLRHLCLRALRMDAVVVSHGSGRRLPRELRADEVRPP
jgi:hypothetical protein